MDFLIANNFLCINYYTISLISSFIWGSETNCNTEVVQSIAALNTVLVKKIMWYLSFSFPCMNHTHFCHLYIKFLYFRFSSGEET